MAKSYRACIVFGAGFMCCYMTQKMIHFLQEMTIFIMYAAWHGCWSWPSKWGWSASDSSTLGCTAPAVFASCNTTLVIISVALSASIRLFLWTFCETCKCILAHVRYYIWGIKILDINILNLILADFCLGLKLISDWLCEGWVVTKVNWMTGDSMSGLL